MTDKAFDPEKVERFDAGDWFSAEPVVAGSDYDALLALYREAISPAFTAANTSSACARDSHLLDLDIKQVAPLPK